MWSTLLKSTQRRIWKFRFMLCWRSFVLALGIASLIFWLFSPALLGMYLAKSPFSFLVLLCLFAFYFNISLMGSNNDNGIVKWFDKLREDRAELKFLIRSAKDAIRLLKKIKKTKLSICEMDFLRTTLGDIGIGCEELRILIYEYDKLK